MGLRAFDDAQHRVDCGAHPSRRIGGQIVRYGVSSLSSQRDRLVLARTLGGAVTRPTRMRPPFLAVSDGRLLYGPYRPAKLAQDRDRPVGEVHELLNLQMRSPAGFPRLHRGAAGDIAAEAAHLKRTMTRCALAVTELLNTQT